MQEADTRTITFPDISPELWDQAMDYLDSPVAARRMKVSDVLKVAKFYDKYEFIEGTKLCDDVLLDYFRSSIDQRQQSSLSLDVDLFIQSVVVAYESNLMESIVLGVRCIFLTMKGDWSTPPYDGCMFSEEQLEKVLPALLHMLSDKNCERVGFDTYRNDSKNSLYRLGAASSIAPILTLPDLDTAGFSKLYVTKCVQQREALMLNQCISHIKPIQTRCRVEDVIQEELVPFQIDGDFYRHPPHLTDNYICSNYSNGMKISITYILGEGSFEGWAIVLSIGRGDEKLCWVAPCSKNLNFPPNAAGKDAILMQ